MKYSICNIFNIGHFFNFFSLRYKKNEEELHKELIKLQECEREIVQEQGQLAALQDHSDHTLNQNSEVLATGLTPEEKLALAMKEKPELLQKLEESSSSQEQVGSMSQIFCKIWKCLY
jgi:hypothetical protein